MSRLTQLFDRLLHGVFGHIMRHFVVLSADSANEVLEKTRRLREEGFLVSFDVMVEDVGDPALIERVHDLYEDLLLAMNEEDHGNIVIKPTSLGLHVSGDGDEKFAKQFRSLVFSVFATNRTHKKLSLEIEVDAESTRTLERTFRVIASVVEKLPDIRKMIRVALPMHIKELPVLCKHYDLLEHPARMVKGAGVYCEDAGLLVDEKTIERRYEEYFLTCLAKKMHPYIATMHDERLLRRVLLSAENRGVEKSEFVIQMLYGLWPGLGRRLIAEGYMVCVYVPIVLPWCRSASRGYVQRRVSMFRKLFWKWLAYPFCKHK